MDYGQSGLSSLHVTTADDPVHHQGRGHPAIASLRIYYQLTKPGIIYGNDLNAAAGFLLASSRFGFSLGRFAAMLIGTALVIGAACVFNNYLDRGIDAKMERTRGRALPAGLVPVRSAMLYAVLLSAAGFIVLLVWTNALTALLGAIGLVAYVALYGYAKRHSIHGTLVGSISGSIPPVAGYTAMSGRLDGAAWLLFLMLVCWQMPHFYAIGIYRYRDYRAAGLPIWPVKQGKRSAVRQIIGWTIAFAVSSLLLTPFGYTGWVYLILAAALAAAWLRVALQGVKADDLDKWARRMFGWSLLVTLGLDILLAVGGRLP